MDKFDTGRPLGKALEIFRNVALEHGVSPRNNIRRESIDSGDGILENIKAVMRRPRKGRHKDAADRFKKTKKRSDRNVCVERIVKSGQESHLRNWMLNPDLLNEVTRRLPQLAPSAFWSPKNKKSLKAFINNSYSHEGALFDSKDVFHDTKIEEALQITSCDPLPCRILANVLASVANDMRPRLSTVTDIAPVAILGLLSAIYTVPDSGAAVTRLAALQLQFLKRNHEMIPLGPDPSSAKVLRPDPNPHRVSPKLLRKRKARKAKLSQTVHHPSTHRSTTSRNDKISRTDVAGRWSKFQYHPPTSTKRKSRSPLPGWASRSSLSSDLSLPPVSKGRVDSPDSANPATSGRSLTAETRQQEQLRSRSNNDESGPPTVLPWSPGAIEPLEALCDHPIANLIEHEMYFEQCDYLGEELRRGLKMRALYKDELEVVLARRSMHVKHCEDALKRWTQSMLRFTFEKLKSHRTDAIRHRRFASLLQHWHREGSQTALKRTSFTAWRRCMMAGRIKRQAEATKQKLKQLHAGKQELKKYQSRARRLREKVRIKRIEFRKLEKKYESKQQVVQQSAEDISDLDNVLKIFRASLVSACQTLILLLPEQIQQVLDDDSEARMAMAGMSSPSFLRWSLLNGINHQVELEQARRWRPDLQEGVANLENTAVVDWESNRVQVVARDAHHSSSSRNLRHSMEKVDVVTAQSQYHWRDDFGAPEAYRRVQAWMDHHLSPGTGMDGIVPPVASTPSPELWPWIFRLLNKLLPATLGVTKACESAVCDSSEYLLKVMKQGSRTNPNVGRYLLQLKHSWRLQRHKAWKAREAPAVAKVRTEHIQFALLVELMQLIPGLEQTTDEAEHEEWKDMAEHVRSQLRAALGIFSMQRKVSSSSERLDNINDDHKAEREQRTLFSECKQLQTTLADAGRRCVKVCRTWIEDGQVWNEVQHHLVRLCWLHLSRPAIWLRRNTMERWAQQLQLFLAGHDVILPKRPLSVRTVSNAEAARIGFRRERWHAEAEKFLDPSVLSLFSRRGASDSTPVTNPLSEETMLMSEATPVDNADADELIEQLSALSTVTELRSEAAMLASEAEKASLQAQHRMREHVFELFEKLDEHSRGTLTLDQVAVYCKRHGMSEGSDEGGALLMFRKYDTDGNRRLNKEEFFELYKEHFEEIARHQLEKFEAVQRGADSETDEEESEDSDSDRERASARAQKNWKTLKKKGIQHTRNTNDKLYQKLKGINPEVFLAKGNLKLFKWYLERHPGTDTFTMCFGNVPAIVVASYYKQLHIVEFLLDYDTENPQALHDKEARLIRKACEDGDVERVQLCLDSIFHEAVQRCALMNAFLSVDVDSAQTSLMITRDTRSALRVDNRKGRAERTRTSHMGHIRKKGGKYTSSDANASLMMACKIGDMLATQEALDIGANVNSLDGDNCTVLMHSAHQGSLKVMEVLLQHGANPLHRDMFRRTALSIATEHDYVDSIIMLLRYNAGPTLYVKDKVGRIPIQITKKEYTREFLAKFMEDTTRSEAKLVLDYLDNPGQSTSTGSYGHGPPEIMSANLSRANFNRRNIFFLQNKLCKAAAHGDVPFLEKAIRAHAKQEMHRRNAVKAAGLESSLSRKEKETLQAAAMDLPDNTDEDNVTPVSMKRDEFNLTPLMHAVACGRLNIVRLLLRTPGADYSAVSNRGNTVLHFAYEHGSHEMLELLFQFGFQRIRKMQNCNRKTPDQLKPRR